MRLTHRRWREFASLSVIATLPTVPAQVGAQSSRGAMEPLPAYRVRVLGVYDSHSGQPIGGAEIVDVGSGTSVETTRSGTATLSFLPDGGNLIRIRKVGYQPLLMALQITPLDSLPITVLLKGSLPALPMIVASEGALRGDSPAVRAFEKRSRDGVGHFITQQDLRKQDGQMLQAVVTSLPGVSVSCEKSSGRCYPVSGRQGAVKKAAACPVQMLIDGIASDSLDLATMPVRQYAGVEFYPSGITAPLPVNAPSNGCGVLFLWTRNR
jgi:hypothetical protein